MGSRVGRRKNGILKQQIKLITGNKPPLLSGQALSQILKHLNEQNAGSIASYSRHVTSPMIPNNVKVWKSEETEQTCHICQCGSTCYAAENTNSHCTWERNYLLEFAMQCSIRMGELLCTPGESVFSVSTGILLCCCKLYLLNCTMSKMKQAPLEEGNIGVLV